MNDPVVARTPYSSAPPDAEPAPGGATLADGVRLAQAGHLAEARVCFERILAADPRSADAWNNIGILHMQDGDADEGIAAFARAHALDPHDLQIRNHLAQANMLRAQDLHRRNRLLQSIPYYRGVLALEPDSVVARVNLTDALARTGEPAERGDFLADTGTATGVHILIACMPKSGSSLLFESLRRLTGWDKADLTYAYLQNEQELYLPNLLAVAGKSTVSQQHCRATEANVQMLQGFGIRPVVLVRNLFDIVMSLVDFYDDGAVINTFIGDDWPALSPAAKRDFVIDHVMPWYVAFHASWCRAAAGDRLDCLLVRYEELIADKPGTLLAIAGFLGLDRTAEDCRAAAAAAEDDKTATRFNRGIAGRGAEALGADQKTRLRRLAESYGSIDFAPVGL